MKRVLIGVPLRLDFSSSFTPIFKRLKKGADKKNLKVNWSNLDNLYLSLNFVGHCEDHEIAEIQNVVSQVSGQVSNIDIEINSVTAFPCIKKARVLWLGVRKKRSLITLHELLNEALEERGFEMRTQDYLPHITLGRIKKQCSVRDLVSPYQRKDFGSIQASEVAVFQSELEEGRSIFQPLNLQPLGV